MAKRPPAGKCVHCLREGVERNWDHVFPVGWYPDTTPDNLDKWKVPSCVTCNSELGRIESRFISLVALTLDPNAREAAGIPQKVLRSLKAEHARDENDAERRIAAAKRVTRRIHRGSVSLENVYPTPGSKLAYGRPDAVPLLIPVKDFERVTEKIVRGITYVTSGKFIDPPYFLEFFPDGCDMEESEFVQLIRARGATAERGPSIRINYVITDDGIAGLFEIVFWGGQIRTYASVDRANSPHTRAQGTRKTKKRIANKVRKRRHMR
jgi:hypothetical protein